MKSVIINDILTLTSVILIPIWKPSNYCVRTDFNPPSGYFIIGIYFIKPFKVCTICMWGMLVLRRTDNTVHSIYACQDPCLHHPCSNTHQHLPGMAGPHIVVTFVRHLWQACCILPDEDKWPHSRLRVYYTGNTVTVRGRGLFLSVVHLPPLTFDSPFTFTVLIIFFADTFQYVVW